MGMLSEAIQQLSSKKDVDPTSAIVQENVAKVLVMFLKQCTKPSFDSHFSVSNAIEYAEILVDKLSQSDYALLLEDLRSLEKSWVVSVILAVSLLHRKIARSSVPESSKLVAKLKTYFDLLSQFIHDIQQDQKVFRARISVLLFEIGNCLSIWHFASRPALWKSSVDRNDIFGAIVESLRLSSNSEDFSARANVALKLLLDFSVIPETAAVRR